MLFAVDTKHIKPGDTITQGECEAVIGFQEESAQKDFQFAMLQLCGVVAKQLKDEHGRELTVRIINNTLQVLTDAESALYNPKRFDAGLRLARRAHRRLMAVNVGKLDSADRQLYAKNVSHQAFKLSMLRKRAEVELKPAERTTPVMVFNERRNR